MTIIPPSTRDPETTSQGGDAATESPDSADIREFAKVSEKTLRRLIEKGRQGAEQLDQVIRSQFQLRGDWDGDGDSDSGGSGDGPDFQ